MRKVALRLDEAFETGEVNRIDAGQLAQILLSIAEELDPPLPNRDRPPQPRSTNMHIGQIHLVTDLTDGQRVYPDRDHSYQVQSEDDPSLDTTIEYVERRGDRLIARGRNGQDYLVSGLGKYELKTIRNWLRR